MKTDIIQAAQRNCELAQRTGATAVSVAERILRAIEKNPFVSVSVKTWCC